MKLYRTWLSLILVGGVTLFFLWPDRTAMTQLTQPPPPPPAPGIPSVLEDIRNTRHNLSSVPIDAATLQRLCDSLQIDPSRCKPGETERRVFTQGTTEVCVFCHTPHGASADASQINAPLWNRNLSTARYTLYDQVWSTSFEAYEVNPPQPGAPTGYSRLCLSCHDGTIALGTVLNPPGSGGYDAFGFSMTYPTGEIPAGGVAGRIPVGSGPSTGDTRLIGTNLQNDHPVSFIYDSALAHRDEELVDPGPPLIPPARVGDPTPISPLRRYPGLESGRFDSVQCTSCHNPHAATYPKFLRTSYFNNDPADPNYAAGGGKILCLYCHDKPGWVTSSHDIDNFVPPLTPSTSNPYNYDGTHTVGQYACRACHDPHTAQGARRLLREGVDAGNNFAIENTCFQCHKPSAELAGGTGTFPPDIRSEFRKDTNSAGPGSAMNLTLSQRHEPVFVARPQEGVELFSPAPPPFNEEPPGTLLRDTVHVECVDCHNPHQVIKTNRLKGMKGIDINGNVVGTHIPGNSREPYVFEVCLRCHGNSYSNLFAGDRFPEDTQTRSDPRAGSPVNGSQFSMKGFSNKRKEFDPATPDTAPDHSQQLKNSSYHPVAAGGRNGSPQLCNQLAVSFNLDCGGGAGVVVPATSFNTVRAAQTLGSLTIQCTDCHNNDKFEKALSGTSTGNNPRIGPITGLPDGSSYKRSTDPKAVPRPDYNSGMQSLSDDPATPQGPHGSTNIRILRAQYNTDIQNSARCYAANNPLDQGCNRGDGRSLAHWDNFRLCFQCHDERAFNPNLGENVLEKKWTNFFGVTLSLSPGQIWEGNLHMYHLRNTGAYCHECHYNVHSNVEAQNTLYGNGLGGDIPADPASEETVMNDGVTDTHLINFGPTVFAKNSTKPRWARGSNGEIRCDLSCHNVDMNSCFYQEPAGANLNFCIVGSASCSWTLP